MKKHPTEVPHYEGRLESLAEQVNAMRYDLVITFYEESIKTLCEQAVSDRKRGRTQTADALDDSIVNLVEFTENMRKVWKICEPHMKEEMGN